MHYEFKISHLAEEFGIHRNTVRNWINAGTIKAQEGPGRRYMMELDEYRRLCHKFGRTPQIHSSDAVNPEPMTGLDDDVAQPLLLTGEKSAIAISPDLSSSCITCGTCASACPISGVDDIDPRKIVRMATLGMDKELVELDWPWKCTMCGKCEESCPANIEIVKLMRAIRGKRERDKVPGPIHKGVQLCLDRGNNLGIPDEDFAFLCKELGEELAEDGCPGFTTPIDVQNARVLVTVNSKEPFAEPDDMKFWWRIFYAAKESWTLSSVNWEGVNWGLFSGDNEAMKTIVGRIVDNMERLNCQVLLLPE